MSELSPLGTCMQDGVDRTGSIGPPVASTHAKIIDAETGKSLGPNEPGELCIKGPQVMMGYFNADEKTRECLSDGGWLRTGDLAYYDDGYFYIADRIKELIKVRGFQVAPAELEELILSNEHVQDVAVVQVPDEVSGEVPRAVSMVLGCEHVSNISHMVPSSRVSCPFAVHRPEARRRSGTGDGGVLEVMGEGKSCAP